MLIMIKLDELVGQSQAHKKTNLPFVFRWVKTWQEYSVKSNVVRI